MTRGYLAARDPFSPSRWRVAISVHSRKLRSGRVFHSSFVPTLAVLGATALLGACGKSGGVGAPTSGPAQSNELTPGLKTIYERSCKNCHSMPSSGAPQTGDAQAWTPRITQGADVLLDHTFNGYKSMP